MIEVYSIVYQPERREPTPPWRYYRVPLEQTQLIADYGIEGDMKGGKQYDRHLNIMTYEVLQGLGAEGFKVQPGELGEQIIIKGLDINSLPPGTRLQLGTSAVVELTKARTGCDWFEKIQEHPRTEAANRLGMMASVITSGPLKVGDSVLVLEAVAE